MRAATDHHITNLGQHRLALLETDGDGTHHVTARRDGNGGAWVISAAGSPDVVAADIHDAIQKMCDAMVVKTHGTLNAPGFSTWVPHIVRRLDGDAVFDRWHASVGRPALT